MFKTIAIMIVMTSTSVLNFTQNLQLRIAPFPKETMQGITIHSMAEIVNISDRPLKIAYGVNGFDLKVDIRYADGTPVIERSRQASMPKPGYEIRELKPGEKIGKALGFAHEYGPGAYIIQIRICSKGPYTKNRQGKEIDSITQQQIWVGEIKSEEYHIKVNEPLGTDKQAYEIYVNARMTMADREETIIRDYPSSTYAGYALTGKGLNQTLSVAANFSVSDQENQIEHVSYNFIVKMKKSREMEARLMTDPGYKAERLKMGRKYFIDYVASAKIFLKSHPNSEVSASIQKKTALALFVLGRERDALDHVKLLAVMTGPEAEEAKALLKTKGVQVSQKSTWSWWPW